MQTIVGQIASDIASLLSSEPYNLFLGFAILGLVFALIIRLFKFKW